MRTLLLIIAACGLFGCTPDKRLIAEAEQTLAQHFEAIRLCDTNALVARYSHGFFIQPKRSRAELLASIARLHDSGVPQFTVFHRDVRREGKGVVVSLSRQTRHGTRSFQEDFELYRQAGTTNFVIQRHDFD